MARPLHSSTTDEKFTSGQADFREHLVRLAWPERQRLAGGLVLLAGSSSISVAFPKIMGSVMDSCLAGGDGAWTPGMAAGALLLSLSVQSGMVAVRGRLLSVAGERVAARLRTETFASLMERHDIGFFDRSRSGELQSRLTSDCTSLQKLVTSDAVGALRAAFLAVGCSAAMFSISPTLLVVSGLTFPPAVLLARRNGERMRARQREVQDLLGEAGAEADRALGNVRSVKLFAMDREVSDRYNGRVELSRQRAEEVGALNALNEAGVGLALQSSVLLVIAVGGQQVIDGSLSYGELSAFLLYSTFTGFAAGSVASAYAELRRATGASERVLRLLQPLPADLERPRTRRLEADQHARASTTSIVIDGAGTHAGGSRDIPATGSRYDPVPIRALPPRGQIDLLDVSFAYPSAPMRPVLHQLSLSIGAGERVALLGPSGCGKSTVAALLAGLYTPQHGTVSVGGVDVDTIERRHLRTQLVSVVPQEPALFSGSLRDNLAVGRPGASEAELRAAADAAGCGDFAHRHWDRDVGERGLQLSGGQKQRVALARVLLRDTPIIILDEFSSALDAQLEGQLFASLREALVGKTVVLITHRESALQLTDRVVQLPVPEAHGAP